MDKSYLFTFQEIAKALGLDTEAPKGGVYEISTDTRSIKSGDLFVALVGDNFDAHAFIGQAVEKGATSAVINSDSKHKASILKDFPQLTLFEVKDTLRALGDLAFYLRHRINPQVLAITGSNGKTTTKEILHSILRHRRSTLKTEGNLNNLIGVPLTLLRLRGESCAIVEMGTNQPGEIGRLCEIATPNAALITNVNASHLEGLKNIETVADEKGDIFRSLTERGTAVVNIDDPNVRKAAMETNAAKISYSMKDPSATVYARNINDYGAYTSFEVVLDLVKAEVTLPIPGKHNVYNALAAIAMASVVGLKLEDMLEGIASAKTADKRMKLELEVGSYTLLDDSYNSNPASNKAALETLSTIADRRRKVAMLGDMLELGKQSRKYHKEMAGDILETGMDAVFLVGKETAATADELSKNKNITFAYFKNVDELCEKLDGLIEEGDCILVKGSRGIRMDKAADAIRTMAKEG